jgi:hypothetical protein
MAGLGLKTGLSASAVGNLYGGANGAMVPGASTVPEGPVTITQQAFGVPPFNQGSDANHGIRAAAISTLALVLLGFIWWTLPR